MPPSPSAQSQLQSPVSPKNRFAWLWTAGKYLVFFLVVYGVINWWRQPTMPANPNLELVDYQGRAVDIAALSRQSPVLVYFWGTWCSVCKVTSPKINALAVSGQYPIVSIAVQSGDNQTLHDYMTTQGYEFVVINDEEGSIFNQWQGQVTPSYVIIKDNEMTQGLTGIQPKWSLQLRLWLTSLL